MPKTRNTGTTLANEAYDELRSDLLSCRLLPGEAIKINELSVSLGTNPIAIREALSRLTSEGLVTAEAQKGFRAAPISQSELRDLTAVRSEIECICLRNALEAGKLEWEGSIVAALHQLLRTPIHTANDPQRNSDDWAYNHAQFHEALVNACDSPVLLGIRAMLYAKSERYRRLSVPLVRFDRDVEGEHKALAAAVLARDADLATTLMLSHLRVTMDILLAE
jgi:DNA-binding GntR family transcriptional regulator